MNIITVNGIEHEVDDSILEKKLLKYIREDLELMGTQTSCNVGACGVCTVLIDNDSKRSCIVPLSEVMGKSVTTIEGVTDKDGTFHPLQKAFIDAGAIKCGFCTSGMVMRGIGLVNKNPEPTKDEIRKAYKGNSCRCTESKQIHDAIGSYSKQLK